MENSFFSSSENLYKYLVSMGLLFIVLTVYYPLKEKQDLQIITIKLESEVNSLNFKIKNNLKNVEVLKNNIKQNGKTIENKKLLSEIDKINNSNFIKQLETEKKYSEITIRKEYISLYNTLFWVFFPFGIVLTLFGFVKWQMTKKYDDNILKLENKKLELEVKKLQNDME